MKNPFDDFDVVHTYSRAQAIADGVLIDVTNATDSTGRRVSPFKFPVAFTSAAYAETVARGGKWVNKELILPRGQDAIGRLWDVFSMLLFAIRRAKTSTSVIHFTVKVSGRLVHLKSICGPGDTPAPVLTIMLPNED